MRVLVIDNNIDPRCWGASDLRRYSALFPGATFEVRRAPQQDLPADPKYYDRIIYSGSFTCILDDEIWISELMDFTKRALSEKVPTLGVCYGHQLLIRVLNGKESVGRAKTPEFGWAEIEILNQSTLLQGLPKRFHSFASHYDEAFEVPRGGIHLARSKDCPHQAFEVSGEPIFGIQFHPEKDLIDAEISHKEHLQKKNKHPFLNAKQGHALYNPEIGQIIFKNFLSLRSSR